MSRLILSDFDTGRTYLLKTLIKYENYRLVNMIQPCYTFKAEMQPELEFCQVKYFVSNFINFDFLGIESSTLRNAEHEHIASVIGEGRGVIKLMNGEQLIGTWEVCYIVTELLSEWTNELYRYSISESIIRSIFSKVVRTIVFLRGRGINLPNFNLENIKCTDSGKIKLAEFNSPLSIGPLEESSLTFTINRYNYVDQHLMDSFVVHNLGVVLLEMKYRWLLGSQPNELLFFNPSRFHAILRNIFSNMDPLYKDLLTSMLHPDPFTKIRLDQICNHPWFFIRRGISDELTSSNTYYN